VDSSANRAAYRPGRMKVNTILLTGRINDKKELRDFFGANDSGGG
jgi:hypothetical protein